MILILFSVSNSTVKLLIPASWNACTNFCAFAISPVPSAATCTVTGELKCDTPLFVTLTVKSKVLLPLPNIVVPVVNAIDEIFVVAPATRL